MKIKLMFIPNYINSIEDLKLVRKGINPRTKERQVAIPWLNAKSENLLINSSGKKAMWADAARNKRCLVLATHFFEWRHYKPQDSKKEFTYPYIIDFYNENEPLYMGGIYNTWTDKVTGETIDTFAIVTTEANELMSIIHNTKKRQPTILTEDLAYEWLMNDLTDERIIEIAKYRLPSEFMFAHTIDRDFRTNPNPLKPFEYYELPDLDLAT
jgi:putative SOS response-associated peptidase YedK